MDTIWARDKERGVLEKEGQGVRKRETGCERRVPLNERRSFVRDCARERKRARGTIV